MVLRPTLGQERRVVPEVIPDTWLLVWDSKQWWHGRHLSSAGRTRLFSRPLQLSGSITKVVN